jgi:hypothetical protein
MMDIQRYAVMNVAKDYNSATDISYNRQSGMRASAYEHLIPEKLFTDQTQPNAPQAISAVKALAIAASQGQKIFTITQANQDIILPQINVDPDVMNEMQNALAAGREITVHQSPITQSGWTGSGYIITDPATGAGAYKISGGANGAELLIFVGALLIMLQIMLAFVASSSLILGIGGTIAAIAALLLGLSLPNDPSATVIFAGTRLVTAVATIALLVFVDGFVLIPFAAVIGIAIAELAVFGAVFTLLFRIFALKNKMFFMVSNERILWV